MDKNPVVKSFVIRFILVTAICLAVCTASKGQTGGDTSQMKSFGNNSNSNVLLGAGSSLVYPLFSKLFTQYAKQAHVMVNYRSVGSARGILQFGNKAVDFGVSDAPLSDDQIKKISAPVLQITLFGRLKAGVSGDSSKSGFAVVSIYKEQNYDGRNLMRAQKLLKMLWWCVHGGQRYGKGTNYAPLSPYAITTAEKLLKSATFGGTPILQ